jgi:hypothetical protein
MNEMEVISLQTGCKGAYWRVGRAGAGAGPHQPRSGGST